MKKMYRLLFNDHPGLRKILANIGWLTGDKLLQMGVGVFVSVWVARYLGPEQFGIFNYALAFVGFFSVLSALGLEGIVVRELVRCPDLEEEVLGSTFLLKFLGGMVAFAAVLVISNILHGHNSLIRWIIGIIGLNCLLQPFKCIDFWFQSRVQAKYIAVSDNASFLIASLGKVILIVKKASLISFALVLLLQNILTMFGMVFFYQKNRKSIFRWHPSPDLAKRLLKESWPVILSGLAIIVYLKVDLLMLRKMVGDSAVGIYSAAARLSEFWYFVPMVIASSIFPSLVKSKKSGDEIYRRRLQTYFDLSALLAYGLVIPLSILAPWIIRTLYGNAYQGADTIFAIHIWAGLFVFLGVARLQYLLNESLLTFSSLATGIGAVINVLLNLILIPKYGGVGAAIATVVSYCLAGYVSSFFYKPVFQCGYYQTMALFFPFRYVW